MDDKELKDYLDTLEYEIDIPSNEYSYEVKSQAINDYIMYLLNN